MAVEYVSGDIFNNKYNADALAHGCNCMGVMGAGIALSFKKRYPAMFEEYRRRCLHVPRLFNPGDAFLWRIDRPFVFNLATQVKPGRCASYDLLETSLCCMLEISSREGISLIAVPKIGAGYGGLDWRKVKQIMHGLFSVWLGTVFVYESLR